MATQAHCAYCFEVLSASLEKRLPLSLRQTEALWKKYNADPTTTDPTSAVVLSDEPDDEDEGLDLDDNSPPATIPPTATTSSSNSAGSPYRPAAISRLLASSPSTTSSSSVQSSSSTPSGGASEASSATSKSSSRSSFFGLGRVLRGEKDKAAGQNEAVGRDSMVDGVEAAEIVTESPLFVTWNVLPRGGAGHGEKRLRGCIGTFEKQDLDEGLRAYALTSAFEDTRFPPISTRELSSLECGVTLLTHFEPISHPLDWSIGVHGLRISFTYHGRRFGSTYLPDVAREQGWTKEEALVSLMRKAGWSGRAEEWRKVDLNVVRYQGRQVRLGYGEWREWRGWAEEELAEE